MKHNEVEAEVLECEELKSRIYGTIVELESKKVLISGNNANEKVVASSSAGITVISHRTPLHQKYQTEFAYVQWGSQKNSMNGGISMKSSITIPQFPQ